MSGHLVLGKFLRKHVLQRRVEKDPQENNSAEEGDDAGNGREEIHSRHREADGKNHSNDWRSESPYFSSGSHFSYPLLLE